MRVSQEKIELRFVRFTNFLVYHSVFWILALAFFIYLVPDNYFTRTYQSILDVHPIYIVIGLLSICLGLILTMLDMLFSYRMIRFIPVQLISFIKSIVYFAAGLVILFVPDYDFFTSLTRNQIDQVLIKIPYDNPDFIRFLVYFYFMCFLDNFFLEMWQKFGGSNFKRWFWGLMNKPSEEVRIFMFIDLKSSTTFAEKLGHKKYSHLVQDVFNDLAVVHNYGGEIYSYLGDGAIITWKVKTGLKNNNFLHAYFAVSKVLEKRKRYYNRKYKLQPRFKAGAHMGKVMVLQVGQVKREISYNGDTINTAARIESKCNELKKNFLVSEALYENIREKDAFRFTNVGEIKLKGKRKALELYGIHKRSTPGKARKKKPKRKS